MSEDLKMKTQILLKQATQLKQTIENEALLSSLSSFFMLFLARRRNTMIQITQDSG